MSFDNNMKSRLLTLFDYLKNNQKIKSQKEFCENIGISKSFFTEIKKGRSGINPDKIQNISEQYKKYTEWLLTGKGEMLKIEDRQPDNTTKNETEMEKDLRIRELEKDNERLKKIIDHLLDSDNSGLKENQGVG